MSKELTGTKKKILDVSLDLFSTYGYSAVSMEQIASAVNIKAPSLYKHYKGKTDIFNSIFSYMNENYSNSIEGLSIHLSDGASDFSEFKKISLKDLTDKVMQVVEVSLHDDYAFKFKKLMTTMQYTSSDMASLYTRQYVDVIIDYHEKLFTKLIQAKVLLNVDAKLMAYQYVAPVYTFMGICERQPERKEECLDLIRRHIAQFNEVYRYREN